MTTILEAQREKNFRAALASFVTEHLPVDDPYTDQMIDAAWRIADQLEHHFLNAFAAFTEKLNRP